MGDYDYANARLRALKSQLISPPEYLELAALTRVDDLIARLAQSTYSEEIRGALARFVGVRVVMEACRLHLANTYRRIRGWFDEEGTRLVGILLSRWDLFNLKTILRGQETGIRPEEILEALVPAGDLDDSALRQLVRQADPVATADLLRTWNVRYAMAIHEARVEFGTTRDWSLFEAALDSLFYEQLLALLERGNENDELVREFMAREIDTANLVTALRLRQVVPVLSSAQRNAAGSWARYFLNGGILPQDYLTSLASAARDEEALAALRASGFGPALGGVDAFDLTKIQRALDRDRVQFGIQFFSRDPLTIAATIGFITAKQAEATNVRVIAQGIALGLGHTEIEKGFVF